MQWFFFSTPQSTGMWEFLFSADFLFLSCQNLCFLLFSAHIWLFYPNFILFSSLFQCFLFFLFYVYGLSHPYNRGNLWCYQAKWVWSLKIWFLFLWQFLLGYCLGFNLGKTPQRLANWFQRYKWLKDWTNSKKQKKQSALFGCILKTVFASSNSFGLITSHLLKFWALKPYKYIGYLPNILLPVLVSHKISKN